MQVIGAGINEIESFDRLCEHSGISNSANILWSSGWYLLVSDNLNV